MKLRRKETVQARWEGSDDVLLVDMETDKVLLTDEAGLIVWWLCDGTRTAEEVLAELSRHYHMTAEVQEAVKAFLDRLCAEGFVRGEPG